jgi:PAS domain S-box-containing protein
MKDEKKTKAQLISELAKMRQQISELEMLHQASVVLSSSLNYETVLDRILEQVSVLVPYDAACILLIEDGLARISRSYGYTQFAMANLPPTTLTFNIADTPALHKMQETRQPLIIPLVENDAQWVYEPGKTWARSHISVPIHIRDQLVGFLKIDNAKPDFFSESDGHRLQSFASGPVAIALRNAQLYDQTRRKITKRVGIIKNERNFVATVLDSVDAMVMVLNPRGCILRFNRACEQTTGYSPDEVRGKHFWDLFLTADKAAKVKTTFEALQTDQPSNDYESHWLTKDGRSRIIAWSNNTFFGKGRKIEYIVSTGIDITEQRQLEERLGRDR